MKLLAILVLGFTLFVAACEDPAANKAKATVNEPSVTNKPADSAQAPATSAPAAKGEALLINPGNSKVEFTGSKVTGKHDGGFKQFSGAIDLVNNKAEESSVYVDIDATSVFTDADKLTEHLKSGDFFEVEKFPKASFRSTKIEADTTKGSGNYLVTGDLTLHGVTKSISFPAEIKISAEAVSVSSEFAINRKDFGIVYAGKADDLIRDDVVIRLDLKTPRKK